MTPPLFAGAPPTRPAVLEGLPPAGLAYLLACEGPKSPLLVVTADEARAERLVADLVALAVGEVALFAGDEHTPFDEVSPDPDAVFARLRLRQRSLAGERPRLVVASAAAVMRRWLPGAAFLAATELFVRGEVAGRERLARHLVRCGYQPVTLVEDEGTFAVRGGIVDLFPAGAERPVRVDLFGDEIATLAEFDPSTQRNHGSLESITLHPIREVIFDDEHVAHALTRLRELGETALVPTRRLHAVMAEIEQRNYFFGVEALWPLFHPAGEGVLETLLGADVGVVIDDRPAVEQALEQYGSRAEHEHARAVDRHRVVAAVADHLEAPATVWAQLWRRAVAVTTPLATTEEAPVRVALEGWEALAREMAARRADAGRGEILDPLVSEIKQQLAARRHVFLASGSRGNAERLRELLRARQLDIPIEEQLPDPTTWRGARRSPRVAILRAGLSGGLLDRDGGVALITDVEVFASERQKKSRRAAAPAEGLATLRDLAEGDLVVHVDHGIGRYLGLKRLVLEGQDGDYVHLEYAGGDRLYLPIYRLGLLQRYRGPSDEARLDKLGGTRWLRAKQRVKDAVLSLAHDLLALQARRKALPGMAVPPPDEHFRAFEASFAYEETADQQRAIDEVLADLQQGRPMDRLVCGDVGFGKTEVAVRAAFAVVAGGRQAAVLVPTTVLAEQHGQTFRERLQGEPVVVEVLSRFRSAREIKALLDRVKRGGVDILIGTHRMLSADVSFRELGLLVVDEEHRFGVKQKERIKQLRSQVHVLTLTATPIPRTLHMAMTGLRDLSIIQTAPAERLSIRTEVTRFDEEVIREALRRELHRGGQVFVVHNRVRSIQAMATIVQRLVPEAKVVVAHGQMGAEQLERIMVEFVRREHNVLVCTAIIESGIDIPSANTMVVNRADTFGLSQLYQLRGRIGRGRERAHAYLLLPRSDRISRDATERLGVLKRFSDLGAGFQIATHDLDLRGAGDLLGAEQSGHIAAVGFELYTELLGEAMERARGEGARADVEPEIKLPVTAVLPEAYVPEPMRRLAFYQRMAQSESDEGIFDVLAEIEDRYGVAPDEARHLAEVMVIRRRLRALGATSLSASVSGEQVSLGLTFIPEPPLDNAVVATWVQRQPATYRLLPSGRLVVTVPLGADPSPRGFLRRVREELGALPRRP